MLVFVNTIKTTFCVGCKRHMNEIFDWFDFSDEMRTAIMTDLLSRDIETDSQ